MEKYNYRQHIRDDINDYISANGIEITSEPECWDELYDKLWAEDDVTGNGKNFYDSSANCAIYLYDNLELFLDAMEDFCLDPHEIFNHRGEFYQWADCLVRLYLMPEVLSSILEEYSYD